MKLKCILSVLLFVFIFSSCRRENEASSINVIREWFVPFSASYAAPAVAGRTDSGVVHFLLYEDNSLRYDFKVFNLKSGDAITGATLNAGNPVTNGPVLLDLMPRISGTYVSGAAFNLSPALMSSLMGDSAIYFNVASTQNTSSLLRGQLNAKITLAANVALSGSQEVPPVATTAAGVAVVRVTADKQVYSRITVDNLEPADQLNAAHIHAGAAGTNGPVIVQLAGNASDFGTVKTVAISDAKYDSLMTLPLYVNVHSTLNPAGKIRGQIK